MPKESRKQMAISVYKDNEDNESKKAAAIFGVLNDLSWAARKSRTEARARGRQSSSLDIL